MKALTLTQPWATAAVLGSKRIETRSWGTKYRGPLAIHAAKGFNVGELMYRSCCWNWIGALWPVGGRMGDNTRWSEVLPFGALIGVVDLVDVRPTETFTVGELDTRRSPSGVAHPAAYDWTERQMGDFSPERFGWVLANPRRIEPVHCKGSLMVWDVPAAVACQVGAQLAGVGAT